MTNPLLESFYHPPFSKIRSEHIVPAINKTLANCYKTIENVVSNGTPYTWESLHQPLSEANDILERIFSSIDHLNSVKDNPKLREAYKQTLFLMSEYNTRVYQNKNLYKAYCSLRYSKYYSTLNRAQKKTINNILINFKLSGINLSKEKQQRYSEITARLSNLNNKFSNNVMDATANWTKLVTNKAKLSGLPENILIIAKEQAEAKGQNGWLLTLDMPMYSSVITYCNDQNIRKEIYLAYNTRASDQGPDAGKWDNSPIIYEILTLRQELAQLLGFKNYTQRSLVNKMAKSQQDILNFLTNLAELARSQGKKEFLQLLNFAKIKYGVEDLKSWNIKWFSEKQKQYLYNITDEQLRPYFPESRVLSGLFKLIKLIYGIIVKRRHNIDVWHPDVGFFELYNENNELYGSFYLDLYMRENKCSGAWMNECICKMRMADGVLRKPVAYLTCNFNRPINGKQALFTHSEVITLFHEFGHCLHHILTSIEIADISGIRGVPQDVIELPSQLMENWCWEPDMLMFISCHYETGKPLSKKLINKMLAAKNYQSAMSILYQIELGLFDFYLHTEFSSVNKMKILEILTKVRQQISVIPNSNWERFPNTFNHIFAGNCYAAGYYSYLWAEVLAADAFSRFKEEGIFNYETGRSFLDNILTCGGCEEPISLFKRFRGREPQIEALLKQYGISVNLNRNCSYLIK